ncbi:MAG: cytochrome c, partial [Usitatibacter sp.]
LAACGEDERSDPSTARQVSAGSAVYARHCASCHGANLEGQPAWRERLANGRLPAPPHDANGHTWHHPDAILFDLVKRGPGPHAPPGYESDMPAFGATLSDAEIRAVLAFIKSRWPEDVRRKQAQISAARAQGK